MIQRKPKEDTFDNLQEMVIFFYSFRWFIFTPCLGPSVRCYNENNINLFFRAYLFNARMLKLAHVNLSSSAISSPRTKVFLNSFPWLCYSPPCLSNIPIFYFVFSYCIFYVLGNNQPNFCFILQPFILVFVSRTSILIVLSLL